MNNVAQSRTYVLRAYFPRRYDNRPTIINAAKKASMEYSRTARPCQIASKEPVESKAAMNAVHRLTPTLGNRMRKTTMVSTLAIAGTMRTLRGELSTFCTAYKTSG